MMKSKNLATKSKRGGAEKNDRAMRVHVAHRVVGIEAVGRKKMGTRRPANSKAYEKECSKPKSKGKGETRQGNSGAGTKRGRTVELCCERNEIWVAGGRLKKNSSRVGRKKARKSPGVIAGRHRL